MKSSLIYFCHIPKTSGTAVINSVYDAYHESLKILKKPEIDDHDPTFNIDLTQKDFNLFLETCYKELDFFSGHFGSISNSIPNCDNLEIFSIIRNPIDQAISMFNNIFRNSTDADWSNVEVFKIRNYLLNAHQPNMQASALHMSMDWEYMNLSRQKGIKNTFRINDIKMSFDDFLQIIKDKNIKLSTLENRTYLLNELEISLNKIKKTNIVLNKQFKANINPHYEKRKELNNIKCFLSQEDIEQFEHRNKLDIQLYEYLKDYEIKNKKCFDSKDI